MNHESKMSKNGDKNTPAEKLNMKSPQEEEEGYATTLELSRKTFVGDFSTKHYAFLEIIDLEGERKQIELGEEDVVIGRTLDCEVKLALDNVSRKHAIIAFRNEEYHIEDLGSTNGTYVNGIRIEKCILRNHDQIEIAGVKIVFNDQQITDKP